MLASPAYMGQVLWFFSSSRCQALKLHNSCDSIEACDLTRHVVDNLGSHVRFEDSIMTL